MIQAFFRLAGEQIVVEVKGTQITFGDVGHMQLSTIEGLKLDYSGSIREFPDLKDKPNWRLEVIKRFKKKIKDLKSETERIDYIVDELKKQGYNPLYKKRVGFRPKKIK